MEHENSSLDRLTPEIVDAVLSENWASFQYFDLKETPPDRIEEEVAFTRLFEKSPYLQAAMLGTVELLKKYPEHDVDEKAHLICQSFFFLGWHARGAADFAQSPPHE